MIVIKDWQIEWAVPSVAIKYKNEHKIFMTADDAEDFARALLVAVKASRRNTSIK